MSTKTTNFEFIKPEKTDPADITTTNENWDKLDEALIQRDKDLSMNGNRITDVATPIDGSDVATRDFVEQHTILGNTYVAVDYNNDGNIVIKPYVADEDELTFKSHIENKDNPHSVTFKQTVYNKTYTTTTNGNGNANTSINCNDHIILSVSAKDSSGNETYICHIYKSDTNRWFVNINNVTSKENVANTQFTLTIWYAAV